MRKEACGLVQGHGLISSPCPVAVSYIEHCLPELIPRLIPIHSPMACAAIYCREYLGITDRLAFISTCIGKKLETDEYGVSPVHYNVTFLKLMEYVREHKVYGPDATDEIEYGLGAFYPAPGGLADNVRWFLGDDALIRVVSGKTYLLIVRIAECLVEAFGSTRVFRTGGDEFVVVQQDHTEAECVQGVRRFRQLMEESGISAAVGYSYNPNYNSDFAGMQALADKRMYEDKERFYRDKGRKMR